MKTEVIMDSTNKEILEEELKENLNEENVAVDNIDNEESADNTNEETVEKSEEETTEDKLKAAEKQAAENWDKYLRQLAEFENFRKRSNAEKAGMYNNGVRDTVEKLLPVIDNFERAFAAVPEDERESGVFKGIEMIQKQLFEVMASLGVEEIPAQGEPFDPNVHAAVMHIEDEGCDDNVIVEVFQKGYKLGDKVIRPSMVKVAN
jgi:molecular chaperone GrpE